MIVVAIIGVLLLVVHLSVPDRAADALKLEAERFVAMLDDCRETAVLSGSPAGIRIAGSGYALERYRREWRPFDQVTDATRRALPEDIAMILPRARIEETSASPAVVCLPSGEAALPGIELVHRRRPGYYRFHDDIDGEFVAEWVAPRA